LKKSIVFIAIFLVGIFATFFIIRTGTFDPKIRVEFNYGIDIDNACAKYNVSPSFIKALCVLESSGSKPSGNRFEPHVYKALKKLKQRKLTKYGIINPTMLKDASDEALKNLATSWGPFQLMGYKCFELGIKVNDIRGDDSIDWSVKWISQSYGNYLGEDKYADAFHIHNTGKPIPKSGRHLTYNKNYVKDGLEYMDYFEH
jgi:hypothetical protein